MTLQIKELGGLPEGEIKLLIENAADRRDTALDMKLQRQSDELKSQLNRTEDLVNATRDQMSDLKGDVGALSAEMRNVSTMMRESLVKHDLWHDADVIFRDGVEIRLSKIELEQSSLTKEVRTLRWISFTSYGIGKMLKFFASKFVEADFWKLIALAFMLYVCQHYFPSLVHWIVKSNELVK